MNAPGAASFGGVLNKFDEMKRLVLLLVILVVGWETFAQTKFQLVAGGCQGRKAGA
ncbi:MAG: hypothetical protein ACLUDU_09255 [Butyricimonas faecihominis]